MVMYEDLDKKKKEILKAIGEGTKDYKTLTTKVSGDDALIDEAIDDLLDDGKIEESDGGFRIPGAPEEGEPAKGKHFCTHCGAKFDPGDRFCPKCGKGQEEKGPEAPPKLEAPAPKAAPGERTLGIKIITLLFAIPALIFFVLGMSTIGDGGIVGIGFSVLFAFVAYRFWHLDKFALYFALVSFSLPVIALTIGMLSGDVPLPLFLVVLIYAYVVRYLYTHRHSFS